MDVFVARQPIFNLHEKVIAYELLYRNGKSNFFDGVDGDNATADVLLHSFLSIGMDKLANQRRCFINFTENLIKKRLPFYFSPDSIVVEILETVEPTKEIIDICRELKANGYVLALDDFVLHDKYASLLPYVDIVKVDFLATTHSERKQIVEKFNNTSVKLLAEKVETRKDFEEAVSLGFSYFQGYFFCKPVIYAGKDVPKYSINYYFQVLDELNCKEPNIDKLAKLIEADVSLTYKLLKLMNLTTFITRQKVKSVKQAILLLGLSEIKKWITVLMLKETNEFSESETITLSLTRAKTAELIASISGYQREQGSFFLMGICSLLDVFLHRPLEEILKEMPIAEEIKAALKGEENLFGLVYKLTLSLEKGSWEDVASYCQRLQVNENNILPIYQQAIEWADRLLCQWADE
jgi:c-di-GMP-related signal transduction protein